MVVRRRESGGIALKIIVLIFAIMFIVELLSCLGWHSLYDAEATGEVTSSEQREETRTSTTRTGKKRRRTKTRTYTVTVSDIDVKYYANEQWYHMRETIDGTRSVGSKLTVYYSKDNPENCTLKEAGVMNCVIYGLFVFVYIVFVITGRFSRRGDSE